MQRSPIMWHFRMIGIVTERKTEHTFSFQYFILFFIFYFSSTTSSSGLYRGRRTVKLFRKLQSAGTYSRCTNKRVRVPLHSDDSATSYCQRPATISTVIIYYDRFSWRGAYESVPGRFTDTLRYDTNRFQPVDGFRVQNFNAKLWKLVPAEEVVTREFPGWTRNQCCAQITLILSR